MLMFFIGLKVCRVLSLLSVCVRVFLLFFQMFFFFCSKMFWISCAQDIVCMLFRLMRCILLNVRLNVVCKNQKIQGHVFTKIHARIRTDAYITKLSFSLQNISKQITSAFFFFGHIIHMSYIDVLCEVYEKTILCVCVSVTRERPCVCFRCTTNVSHLRARAPFLCSKSQDRIRAFLLSDKNDYFFVLLLCTMEWIFLLNGHKKTNAKIHCCSRYIFKQRILFCSSCKMGYELLFLFDSGELLRHKGEYTQR